MRRALAALAIATSLAVVPQGLVAAQGAKDIHLAGGQRGFTTALGNHMNASAWVFADKGHLKYQGTISGTVFRLVCRPRIGRFEVWRSTWYPNAEGSVDVFANCRDRKTGLRYTIDVRFGDFGEPGKNNDRVCAKIERGGLRWWDCGRIQSGNVQILRDTR